MPHDPLRIGLLIESPAISRWEADIVEELLAESGIQFTHLFHLKIKNHLADKIRKIPTRGGWLFANKIDLLFSNIIRYFSSREGIQNPDDRVRARDLLPEATWVELQPTLSSRGLVARIRAEDVEAVRTYGLDVVLRFNYGIIKGDILKSSRFGVWSYHHGDNRVNRGGPPGFWEFMHLQPRTGVTLQILNEDLDNGTVIDRAFFSTYPLSWNENRRRVYEKSKFMMIDALKTLAKSRSVEAWSDDQPSIYSGPLYVAPTFMQSLQAMSKQAYRVARKLFLRVAYKEQWRLIVDASPTHSLSIRSMDVLEPPKDRFWADPFTIARENDHYIVFEDYRFKRGFGTISALEIGGENKYYEDIINEGTHFSYPFLFESAGQIYMIPETHTRGTVEIWKSVDFPLRWTKVRNILEGVSAADTTLFFHEGLWWMFTNIDRFGRNEHIEELYLFYSATLESETWTPHPRNPVVRDPLGARMAGRIWNDRQNRIIRSGQDNTLYEYGSGIVFFEVTEISKTEYRERKIGGIFPEWNKNAVGAHHFEENHGMVIMDARFRMPKIF